MFCTAYFVMQMIEIRQNGYGKQGTFSKNVADGKTAATGRVQSKCYRPTWKRVLKRKETALIKREPSTAVKNPLTSKPGKMAEASSSISALMTSKKSPSVTTISGSESNIKIGRMKVLTKPKTNAASNADQTLLTVMSGTKVAVA